MRRIVASMADKPTLQKPVVFRPTRENAAWLARFKKSHGKITDLCNRGIELARKELEKFSV